MKRTLFFIYIKKLCYFRIDLILHGEFYYNNKKKFMCEDSKQTSITRYPVLILFFKIFISRKILKYKKYFGYKLKLLWWDIDFIIIL
jgi:hypothetical protein